MMLGVTEWWRVSASPLRSQIFPLPKGSVIIRDVNTIHAGCPNLSARDRLMPSFIFEPKEWTDMRADFAAKGRWDMLPGHWGFPQISAEQATLLHPDICRDNAHLLPERPTGDETSFDQCRQASSCFGFNADKLRRLVTKRLDIFEKYKRRDECYSLETHIRGQLGRYIRREPFRCSL
eukprot:gnl/TRDRNA2_/TRDRNA2_154955_c0_seq1.p1 gnl/TRDRNA2_/TRDRNA2_154955_c0~~gnl/TRDRNA2_/TRDRNA2_154955_c0_seq1.p1  ORF type:complete len:178 (-),score=20.66 gnl/TRDRNA2_/TRDRNA2_154955_c0_seq1:152-685(-)